MTRSEPSVPWFKEFITALPHLTDRQLTSLLYDLIHELRIRTETRAREEGPKGRMPEPWRLRSR